MASNRVSVSPIWNDLLHVHYSTLNVPRLQICYRDDQVPFREISRFTRRPSTNLWDVAPFLFIKFSVSRLFLIILNSVAHVSVHLPLIRQQIAISLQLTVEIMPVSIFSPLFKQATGCRWVKVTDLKTEKPTTESEKSDKSSKPKDFITGNRKKRDLVSCLALKQVNDVIWHVQITNLDNSAANWTTTYTGTVKK